MALTLGMSLASCSKQDSPAAPTAAAAVSPAQSYDAIAKDGKGFTAGALMSAQTVYVLFDAQCPHCGALWNASLPLQKKVKFVWIPVSLMNPKSTLQGAALLTAANPVELMSAQTVYVLFDAQCPHCGALWNASLPLQKKVKFVWVPVSDRKSVV